MSNNSSKNTEAYTLTQETGTTNQLMNGNLAYNNIHIDGRNVDDLINIYKHL